MLSPKEQEPYLIETKTKQTLKFSKMEADNEAEHIQQAGSDVEVYHKGTLQYRLSGILQGNLFQ